jgi:hypothetical protein
MNNFSKETSFLLLNHQICLLKHAPTNITYLIATANISTGWMQFLILLLRRCWRLSVCLSVCPPIGDAIRRKMRVIFENNLKTCLRHLAVHQIVCNSHRILLFLTCICLSRRFFRVTLEISRAECNIDVVQGTLTSTDTCIGYHVTQFKVSRKVILHTRYVSTCVGAGGGRGRGTKIKTKANRCGACYCSIMLDAHSVTSMADADIDAVQKRKNPERIKQYRL